MAATLVLEASAERRVGSSPTWGTKIWVVNFDGEATALNRSEDSSNLSRPTKASPLHTEYNETSSM